MTDTLKAPVGEKGKYLGPLNRSEDVLLVRKLLEPHLKKLGMVYLLKKKEEEKGECDPQLIKAIRVFQEKRLKLLWSDENANIHKSPAYDGRIDPGDETFWALTHSAVDETSKRAVIKRPAKGLVLAGGKDLPGRSDATGAFLVGAKAFCALYHLSKWVPIDNTQSYEKRCQATYGAMDKAEDGTLDVIAFFGHGTPGSLPTFGFFTGDIGRLATKIKAKCKKKFGDPPLRLFRWRVRRLCRQAGHRDQQWFKSGRSPHGIWSSHRRSLVSKCLLQLFPGARIRRVSDNIAICNLAEEDDGGGSMGQIPFYVR